MDNIMVMQSTEYRYHIDAKGAIVLDQYILNGNDYVIVPEKIAECTVTEIGENAFTNHEEIKEIIFPNSLEKIADRAFLGCRKLKKIKFGSNIRWIGSNAFAECISLSELKISSVLDCLGEAAFILSGLKRVELAGIKQWEANSFSLCSGLKYFALKRCDFIPEGTFKHDICLSDVIFEEPVETIDATAFYDCRNFHDIRYMYWDFSIDDTHSEMGKHDIIIDELYQQKNAYKRILKYARIILGSYLELEEDEEDMVTAGQLYSNIRDKKISIEKIFSIYPSEAVEILENGKIPVLSAEEVKLQIRDGEVLHYMESGILYLSNNEEFQIDRGALYITSQRILFATGSKTYEILLKQLAKVVLYDAMPEILEIQGIDKVLFVQTAAVEQTYAFLKIIANFTESEDINDNTEKISLDYFKNADMNTYICGLKTLSETDMPDDMHQNMILMIGALEKYNAALEKYPSYSQQADRFMDYYIPEVIKLVFDFQEYEKAGISEQKINPVHSKVKASIYKVTSAAIQGLDEIYKSATMNTVARAEALREILGQDGFVDPDHKIQ